LFLITQIEIPKSGGDTGRIIVEVFSVVAESLNRYILHFLHFQAADRIFEKVPPRKNIALSRVAVTSIRIVSMPVNERKFRSSRIVMLIRLLHFFSRSLPDFKKGTSLIKRKRMSEKLPRSLPCLDIQAGIKQLEGNKELYIKLLKKFAECNYDLAEKIADTLANNEEKKARILAHSTKGVSGSIGATELYLASAALEVAITQGKTENALQDFAAILKTVLRSIAALLHDQEHDSPAPAAGKDVDLKILFPLLDELDACLRAGDFNALESYITLQKAVADTAVATEVNTWTASVNRFEYKQVAEKLAMLRIRLRNRTF
jgi:HPt (histidine-containing phosphotransfer) domain-containing protein